ELVVEEAGASAAGDRLVEDGAARHLLDVLFEVADRQLLRDRDVPFVGRFLADDHAEERGLAGPVGPDKTDAFTGVELKGSVDEEDLLPVLFADLGKRNHGWISIGPPIIIASRVTAASRRSGRPSRTTRRAEPANSSRDRRLGLRAGRPEPPGR